MAVFGTGAPPRIQLPARRTEYRRPWPRTIRGWPGPSPIAPAPQERCDGPGAVDDGTATRRACGWVGDPRGLVGGGGVPGDEPGAGRTGRRLARVSYDKQVRPIFQARCQGCHQPAKSGGGYVMTDFARLLAGGESHEPAVVAGQPDASHLVAQITPDATARPRCPRGNPRSPRPRSTSSAAGSPQGRRTTRPRRPPRLRPRPPAHLRPPARHHRARLRPRRPPPGRRRVPRGPALDGRRVGAGRPPGRPGRADRVGPVLARRQAPGGGRRVALPDGRGPGLGRRGAAAHLSVAVTFDTVNGGQLVARRVQDRLRLRRQLGPRDRRADRGAGPVHGLAQRLGARHRVRRRRPPGLGRPRHDAPS